MNKLQKLFRRIIRVAKFRVNGETRWKIVGIARFYSSHVFLSPVSRPSAMMFQSFGQISPGRSFLEFLTSLLSIRRMLVSYVAAVEANRISITWTNVAQSRQKSNGGCGCSQGRTCRVKNDPLCGTFAHNELISSIVTSPTVQRRCRLGICKLMYGVFLWIDPRERVSRDTWIEDLTWHLHACETFENSKLIR